MKIRAATEADVETLFAIRTGVQENHQSYEELAASEVTPESISKMLRTTSRAWVAEIEEQPVAFSMVDAQQGTVFALFVYPTYQGWGLGRALLQKAEDWLFAQGWEEIWLTTSADPTLKANTFYPNQGWRVQGVAADGQLKYVKRKPTKE